MKTPIARIFVKPSRPNNHILIGASMNDFLKEGHVYEITETMGVIQLTDLGKSLIADDKITKGSVDQLLALSQGKHCLADDKNSKN